MASRSGLRALRGLSGALFWGWGPRGLCGLGVEGGDSEEVVGGAGEEEPGSVPLPTFVAELAAAGDGFDPAEGFFDPGPDRLTDTVSGVPCGASVDGAAPAGRGRGPRRGDARGPAGSAKTGGVPALFGPRPSPPAPAPEAGEPFH